MARKVRLRAGQPYDITGQDQQSIYVIGEGVAVLRAEWPESPRHTVAMLLTGDAGFMRAIPAGEASSLFTFSPVTLLLLGAPELTQIWDRGIQIRDRLLMRIADEQARARLHAAMTSVLTVEQRVASFLVDLTFRLCPVGAPRVLDLPLSRADIAEYLAVNADTLSRVMSHLRSTDILSQQGRSRIIIRNWKALTALSPMTSAFEALALRRDAKPGG